MTNPSEEVETKAILYSARSTSPLGRIALGNIGLYEATELSFLVEPTVCGERLCDLQWNFYLISLCFPESITQVI